MVGKLPFWQHDCSQSCLYDRLLRLWQILCFSLCWVKTCCSQELHGLSGDHFHFRSLRYFAERQSWRHGFGHSAGQRRKWTHNRNTRGAKASLFRASSGAYRAVIEHRRRRAVPVYLPLFLELKSIYGCLYIAVVAIKPIYSITF